MKKLGDCRSEFRCKRLLTLASYRSSHLRLQKFHFLVGSRFDATSNPEDTATLPFAVGANSLRKEACCTKVTQKNVVSGYANAWQKTIARMGESVYRRPPKEYIGMPLRMKAVPRLR